MANCEAKTKNGKPCQIPALEGKKYCHIHDRQKGWRKFLAISTIVTIFLGILGFTADVVGLFGYFGISSPVKITTTPDPKATANFLATTRPTIALTAPIDFSGRALIGSMRLVPNKQTINLNSEFTVNIVIDTNGVRVIGVDAVLKYDIEKLGVVGITEGSFSPGVYPTIDSENGILYISALSSRRCEEPGSYIIANVTFRTLKVGKTNLEFIFDRSNIIDCYDINAADTLGTVLNGEYEIIAP